MEPIPNSEPLSLFISSIPFHKEDSYIIKEISSSYSKILILGGLGFIGKNFFEYLNTNELFSTIIIADKSLPEISYIPSYKLPQYLQNPKVKFFQIDLCNEKAIRNIFIENPDIDIVVNLASETRLGLSEEDYQNRCYKLPVLCGRLAAEFKITKFIQVSCCKIYKSGSSNEIKPWDIRFFHLKEAEKKMKSIPELNLIILRAAIVYGPYDFNGEMILRIGGSLIYKALNEKMKVMWDDELKTNTINVIDVCRAILYSIIHCQKGEIYNIVDENDSDQSKIYRILKEIFNIEIECIGNMKSYLLRFSLDHFIQILNEKHLQKWFELGFKFNTLNSPVNIVVYKENLTGNHMNINGEAFKKKTGFKCLFPLLETNYFRALIQDYVIKGFFPPIL